MISTVPHHILVQSTASKIVPMVNLESLMTVNICQVLSYRSFSISYLLVGTRDGLLRDKWHDEPHKSILSHRVRRAPRAVEFADPIEQSFSPSASSNGETTASWSTEGVQIIEEDIPMVSAGYRTPDEEVIHAYVVELTIGNLHVSEMSVLLDASYDRQKVYVEWKFLDFPLDECETSGRLLPLPRDPRSVAEFNFQKSYTLSERQYQLLRQWIELGNR
ncbi:unnamed protein product [Gongylonema pulchrum]|uniref:RPGR1_C domain-containing protein n=1 Tax=Gongylonema pulchrum TaxID=637853 RepID=A0A183D7T4_9BILA|nr:unnamed protein product [Gongylonema pulchrum]